MGVPAVVTSRGGSPEAVDEGITGWSVDVLEPQALAERVIAVLDSNSWRAAARARDRCLCASGLVLNAC